jgi:deazaflavin-dependent oxidoreductase (nitroreductase family)
MPDDVLREQFLYLTTTGRKTGLRRRIEIWFVASGGHLYVLAEQFHKAQWVLNIMKSPRVRVLLAGHTHAATAVVLDPNRDAAEWQTVRELAREKYGWGDGLPVRISPDEPLCGAPPAPQG